MQVRLQWVQCWNSSMGNSGTRWNIWAKSSTVQNSIILLLIVSLLLLGMLWHVGSITLGLYILWSLQITLLSLIYRVAATCLGAMHVGLSFCLSLSSLCSMLGVTVTLLIIFHVFNWILLLTLLALDRLFLFLTRVHCVITLSQLNKNVLSLGLKLWRLLFHLLVTFSTVVICFVVFIATIFVLSFLLSLDWSPRF